MDRRPAPPGRAFTLVELLVVIGIISVLVALLMPGLTAARRQAQAVQCASHLRTIGHAMQQYANEYKGRVPRDYYYGIEYVQGHILWAEAFSKYVGQPIPDVPDISDARDVVLYPQLMRIGVYQCPAFPDERQPLDYVSNGWWAGFVGVSAPLINVTRMPRSGQVVYITEASARLPTNRFGTHDVFDVSHLPVVPNGLPQLSSRVLNDKRHGGRINLLYLDGHVDSRHYKEVVEKDFNWLAP